MKHVNIVFRIQLLKKYNLPCRGTWEEPWLEIFQNSRWYMYNV